MSNPTITPPTMSLKPSEAIEALVALFKAGMSVMLTGRQGIGKSDLMYQAVVERLKWRYITLHSVTMQPPDLMGLPHEGKRGGRAVADFLPYGFLEQLMEIKEPTVVVWEDIGTTPPATQPALMQLILAKQLNGKQLSDKIIWAATTNRRQDLSGVASFNNALADRFNYIIELQPDAMDWVTWGLKHQMPPVLLAYAKLNPKVITDFIQPRDIVKGNSPRSLAKLGETLVQAERDGAECLLDPRIFSAAIGAEHGISFYGFYRTFGVLPDITEVLSNPKKAPLVPSDRPDAQWVLMRGLAHALTPDNFGTAAKYLDRVPPEMAVICIREAVDLTPTLKQTSTYIEFTTKHQHIYGLSGD